MLWLEPCSHDWGWKTLLQELVLDRKGVMLWYGSQACRGEAVS